MEYPSIIEVNKTSHEQICRWYRFLGSPTTELEVSTMNAICARLNELGGFTPEISKRIGW